MYSHLYLKKRQKEALTKMLNEHINPRTIKGMQKLQIHKYRYDKMERRVSYGTIPLFSPFGKRPLQQTEQALNSLPLQLVSASFPTIVYI